MLDKLFQRGKDFLGVKYPIVSGGMTWISNYELCKAVSDAGAFPVLAGGNMPPDLFEEEVDKCVEGLDKPFAVNLITIAPNYRTHFEILQGKDVPFVVFAANFPKKHDVVGMKDAGKKTICFASTDSIARQMRRFGIDALILEGSEAGGHIGHVSLTILLQQVLMQMRDFPIFVAGGVADGQMIAHLLLMGATGVQMGTRFVVTEECCAHPKMKEAFQKARARQAVSTPQYDSKLPVVAVRALANKSMERFGAFQLELLAKLNKGEIHREEAQYEVESFWIGGLRKAVMEGDVDGGSVMAGQSVGLVDKIMPVADMIQEIVGQTEAELARVKGVVDAL
ncbi:MAG: NAD(P)H-dependent flavin oxidoreductase [Candidatus Sumerlaeota bacterium]